MYPLNLAIHSTLLWIGLVDLITNIALCFGLQFALFFDLHFAWSTVANNMPLTTAKCALNNLLAAMVDLHLIFIGSDSLLSLCASKSVVDLSLKCSQMFCSNPRLLKHMRIFAYNFCLHRLLGKTFHEKHYQLMFNNFNTITEPCVDLLGKGQNSFSEILNIFTRQLANFTLQWKFVLFICDFAISVC